MSTTEQTECDCGNHGDCGFCLDRDYPALSPRAMEHFCETGCSAGDQPGHLSDPPAPERLSGMDNEFSSHIASPNTVPQYMEHTHDWRPIPNDCGFYTCACGWFGRRELSDGAMTARPTLRRLKRVPPGECFRCGTDRGVDRNINLCALCWKIELKVEVRR